MILLVGKHTKHLFRFVRWELEVALELGLPIIAVNLNNKRGYDSDLCPPILSDKYVVHISFKMAIIKYALDNFPGEFATRDKSQSGNRLYNEEVYKRLGLL